MLHLRIEEPLRFFIGDELLQLCHKMFALLWKLALDAAAPAAVLLLLYMLLDLASCFTRCCVCCSPPS